MTMLSIVFGFRDRDTTRVKRCLDSLARQSFTDFEVLFVDYGSQPITAQAIKTLVESYPFARYIYTETRGYAWNRSHALNIGSKVASGHYLMTTDVDMIYMPDFLATFMQQATENREIHICPYLLPENFADWDNLPAYIGQFEKGTLSMRGACQMIATRVFKEIGGYDEYYRYYGVEDRDMSQRLRVLNVEEVWLTDETAMFHQAHSPANYSVKGLMPDGVRDRLEIYFMRHQAEAIRNPHEWGIIHTQANRPVLHFVDVDKQILRERPELHHFEFSPANPKAVGKLSEKFRDLASGHALAINHAFFPQPTPKSDFVLSWLNRIFYRVNKTHLDYPTNHLHNFLIHFIEPPAPHIADYYLNLAVLDGVSILVKA